MKHIFKTSFLLILASLVISACSNVDEWEPEHKTDASVILSESLMGGLGNFTTYSVSGDQEWLGDESYAIMTGYVSPTNYANEDWLISPEIDLTKATEANVSFQHVVRYFDAPNEAATVWISENYTFGDPTAATWIKLETQPFVDYSSWDFVPSGEISLTPWAGKKVRVAFKYTSTNTDAGTWELRNVVVTDKEAVVVERNYGSGKEKDPFTVDGAVYNQGSGAWVEGYIVGYIYVGSTSNTYVFSSDTCTQNTNILIAASLSSLYISKAMPVQLPTGTARNALNLRDNKGNIGRKVKLYGNLSTYFTVPGLRDVSYYEFEDGTFGGTKPFDPTDALFAETLLTKASFDKFTAVSVTGAQFWSHSTQYGAMVSGYASGRSYANEDWFISPPIDLTGKSGVQLSFDHARGPAGSINVGVTKGYYTVWVSNNYVSGAPDTATWTELTGVNHGTTAWGFVSSGGLAIPAANLKKDLRFAFKYLCTDAESATWEVKNVMLR